ncbi:MAG TPA: ABC transporter substrate-binding protein, partial [Candidatus Caccovicinus merdipullorum]|nr:ABC transporter substrate-binding protein [Candidatus Caccovicinus merdipullorum]
MMKRVVSLGLAAVMTASLAACGSSSSDTTTAAADAAENTAAAEGGDSASAEGGSFKIGVIGPLTGDNAAYGLAVQHGAELAAKEINEAGGINGASIELQAQDDEADPEKSINAYNTLKDWGMQMLVGTTTSGSCIAVAAETYNDNMFQITPSGSAVECVENPNVFRVCFSDPDQGTASAQYIGEHQLATKVAIIYDSSSVYSDGIRENFVAEAANQGIEIVASEAFTADSKTDFSVQLDKAKEAGAELVFLPIYYQEASIILKQAADKDFSPIFFGCDGMDGILTVENFDVSLAEGLMLLTPFSADAEDAQDFTAAYTEAYGETPNQFAADSYDAVYAIKAAAEKAGITPDMSASDICDAIVPAMTQITIDGLTGTGMTWNEAGEPEKAPKAVKIVN